MRFFSAFLCLFWIAPSQGQNIQKDLALGKQYSQFIENAVGVYENPELTAYIKAVGDKLTPHLEVQLFDFKYAILATPEPNAFSIPGGYLYITTGMFPFLESEDELACIMAHEIIHANNRHVIKSNRKGIIPGILQIPGAIIGAVIGEDIGKAINSPLKQISQLTHASYSRKHEIEADLEGVEIAAKAGYDPQALTALLMRIGKYGEIVTGSVEENHKLATHPITADRVQKIEKIMPTLARGAKANLKDDFLSGFDGVLAGSDPSRGIFVENAFYHPTLDFKLVFPDDWEVAFSGNTVAGGLEAQKELVQVSYGVNTKSPKEIAEGYLNALSPYLKESIASSDEIAVDTLKGYRITFKQDAGDNLYYGARIWLAQDSLLFSFLTLNTDEDQAKLETVVTSLGKTTATERASIKANMLRMVVPDAGETAASIIERTNSVLSEALLHLINQIEQGAHFEAGKKVKVVVPEPY